VPSCDTNHAIIVLRRAGSLVCSREGLRKALAASAAQTAVRAQQGIFAAQLQLATRHHGAVAGSAGSPPARQEPCAPGPRVARWQRCAAGAASAQGCRPPFFHHCHACLPAALILTSEQHCTTLRHLPAACASQPPAPPLSPSPSPLPQCTTLLNSMWPPCLRATWSTRSSQTATGA
jgi:hypothetical protein